MDKPYTHMGVCHAIWKETGHWKKSSVALFKIGDEWQSGDDVFDAEGKHPSGAYLDLKTIMPLEKNPQSEEETHPCETRACSDCWNCPG